MAFLFGCCGRDQGGEMEKLWLFVFPLGIAMVIPEG